jgi:prepilin-type N-terminal cleavage/methylation domain-containing protein
MFMYLHKNKKGFTLIELMVVVAIIGVLALLGLRLYATQQEKAKNAVVKANVGTIQTLIQSELADTAVSVIDLDTDIFAESGIHNPFTGTEQVANGDGSIGSVDATIQDFDEDGTNDGFIINGIAGDSTDVYDTDLEAHK